MIKHKMRAAGPVLVAGTGERCLSALNSRQFLTEDGAVSAQREILVKEASLYIHWPYCLKRCSYCNFNKYIPKGDNNHIVSQCLQQEVATLLQLSQVSRVTSVFLGGGTPSLAHPSTVSDILEAVSRQSLQNDDLSRLGRDHSAHHALQTVEEARRLRPGKVSVDVMFGRPGQSLASWEAELSELLQLCDDHVSLYQLTPERGTLLFKQIRGGEVTLPGDHVMAEMYESARRTLQRHGFEQYEVSNFARNSEVSHHNMSYWKGRQYIGVGPGAHGRFVPLGLGGAHREARTQTLEPDVWIREVRRHGHGTRRRIQLGHLALLEEVLVMGLRMTEGITHKHWQLFSPQLGLRDIFGSSADVQEFFHRGQLTLDDGGLHCSRDGLALLDSMLPTLLLELERQQTVESAKS
ncbi:radical S-adenosyl methionine domain-containing protein 1, mitochondrial isoform X2 [Phyllopteryx taeniolatus]|uniref:radical S-adenosyl methionine domain-containing protein 1, mitochondrial isoform X2 n=1 Tax=Phyllopteryx taeniolatus TaxID=161469 RepID=UPI002AD2C0B1|nr:radical S-adenosyl methionine domain-containing protein 1, mitochondrial isoform X2 [Phyllopteryx taeniolatus]